MITALLLSLAVGQMPPVIRPRQYRSEGAERVSRLGQDSNLPLCAALLAADKAGAWDCVNGDGTMLAGSATTWVATGAPTNTTEAGQPVRTYTAIQNDQQPANVAFPQSDFSVCKHHRSTSIANTQMVSFGINGGGPANYTALPAELQANGNIISGISDGVAVANFTSSTAPLPIVSGTWYLVCFTYQRVGGAANNVGTLYVNGTNVGSSAVLRLASAMSLVWTTNGYQGGATGNASSMRGQLVTYKLLSAADIARIYAAVSP